MNRAHYLALAETMKPSKKTVTLMHASAEPMQITFDHPEAGAVIPGLVANPILIEFLFNETEDGKPAMLEFTLDNIIALLMRMGPHAVAAVIAASMRDEDTGASFAGDAEIQAWIRKWSPSDQIEAVIAIHEVTNLVSFFARVWSLATRFQAEVGQAVQNAMQNAENSTKPSSEEPQSVSESLPAQPENFNGRRSQNPNPSSEPIEPMSPSDSEKRSPVSAEAA